MPTVSPFRGWRYAAAAGELADLISPPYDVIGPAQADRLAARDPHNSVRLDLPQPMAGAGAGQPLCPRGDDGARLAGRGPAGPR